ncbi:hypothetical protein ARNL5_03893 [Anaerolineae bacterium]|nr:hypothetical protein ARNL5_03893 [Anaerolineae bacterium]
MRIGYRLPLSCLSYQTFTVLCKGYNRGSRSVPFRIRNYNRVIAFHYGNNRVGRS